MVVIVVRLAVFVRVQSIHPQQVVLQPVWRLLVWKVGHRPSSLIQDGAHYNPERSSGGEPTYWVKAPQENPPPRVRGLSVARSTD